MTLIRNLPAIVVTSPSDLLPIEDVSELKTKRITLEQLAAALALVVGSDAVFTEDIPVVLSSGKSFGRWTNGQTIPAIGKTSGQVIREANSEFIAPTFSAFMISGQAGQIEVGETIPSGTKTFVWATTNPSTIAANSIQISDVTTGTVLLSSQPNDGSQAYNLASPIAFTTPRSEVFRIIGTNTDTSPANFQRDLTVRSTYKIFHGPSSAVPANSAAVRALGANRFTDAGNTFILNTGNSQKIFSVAMPATMSLVSVYDLDALNVNITSEYDLSTFSVNDAAGSPVSYKVYTMQQAVPYSANHQHQITVA